MTTVFPARGDLEATGDHQWIHIDPGRAAEGPCGRTITHGYLTLSLIPRLGGELFRFESGGAGVAAGMQLRTRYTIESDTGGKPACVAEALTLLLP